MNKNFLFMSDSTIALLLFIGIIVFLLAGIVYAIRQKNTQCSGSFASMAVFHDMQSKEKQSAVEIIIEKQAQKKWEDEESGEGENKIEIMQNNSKDPITLLHDR
jgi:predicted Holliday junction resolvase-like endonuclease